MVYKKVVITPVDEQTGELLIALLSNEGAEGFEELQDSLIAFFPEQDFNQTELANILRTFSLGHTVEDIQKTNWNKEWESNFEPVIVSDFCTVRADFHDLEASTRYEIIITPKMSFGTGHHATTQLMMKQMEGLDFMDKKVLDFGTGTGILAILAAKLGAGEVVAIDNDEWSVTNSIENAERNSTDLSISLGSLEDVQQKDFDIILANINRHILLQYMSDLAGKLVPGGYILMSGLLAEDREIITQAALARGMKFLKMDTDNNWIALLFQNRAH